jgi:hypothetical protein
MKKVQVALESAYCELHFPSRYEILPHRKTLSLSLLQMFVPLQTVARLECCRNQLGRCFPVSSVCVCLSLSLSLSLSLNSKSLFTGEQIFSFFLLQPRPLQFVNNLFYFSPFNLPFYSNAHDFF